jgi:hypothetical protein
MPAHILGAFITANPPTASISNPTTTKSAKEEIERTLGC